MVYFLAMSTEVESYIRALKKWGEPNKIRPDNRSAVMPHFNDDGTRDDYLVSCAPDDSHTTIEVARNRGVLGQKDSDFEVYKTLQDGKSTVLTLKTQAYSAARLLRITHRKVA